MRVMTIDFTLSEANVKGSKVTPAKDSMTFSRQDLLRGLDEIARGDATPARAAAVLRAAIGHPNKLAGRVYSALFELTSSALTNRPAEDLDAWFDVLRHASALARRADDGQLAERIWVLSDLVAHAARFATLQPRAEVLQRKHVREILLLLACQESAVRRSDIADHTGLEEANLSRVLSLLQKHGLVIRGREGKEAHFELTETGRTAIAEFRPAPAAPAPDPDAWWNDLPAAVGIWGKDHAPVACNTALHELVVLDGSHRLQPAWDVWRKSLAAAAWEERPLEQDGAWELRLGEDRWLLYVERVIRDGRRLVMAQDISTQKLAARGLEIRLGVVAEQEAAAREELASVQRTSQAYRIAVEQMREAFLEVTTPDAGRLGAMPHGIGYGPPRTAPEADLWTAHRHLGALHVAMKHFMEPPALLPRLQHEDYEVFDLKQFVSEAVEATNTLYEPDIRLEFGKVGRVKAPTAMRTAVGQLLMHCGRARMTGVLETKVTGSNLSLTLSGKPAGAAGIRRYGTLGVGADDTLSYCRTIADNYGGDFKVVQGKHNTHDLLNLTLPIEMIGPPRVKRKSRRLGV